RTFIEAGSSFSKRAKFAWNDSPKTDVPDLSRRGTLQIFFAKQSLFREFVETEKQRVPGKRRERLIRRVPVAGGIKWENLPDFHPGGLQKIGKPIRFPTQVTDAVGTRERGRM